MEVDVEDDSLRFDYGTDPNNAATYDRDSILACKCDKGYEGYDCSQSEYILMAMKYLIANVL
jgi:hypothetical protein